MLFINKKSFLIIIRHGFACKYSYLSFHLFDLICVFAEKKKKLYLFSFSIGEIVQINVRQIQGEQQKRVFYFLNFVYNDRLLYNSGYVLTFIS